MVGYIQFLGPRVYERLGYTLFGMIDNHPPGQQRVFLHKKLIG
jgi:hypothetical protein